MQISSLQQSPIIDAIKLHKFSFRTYSSFTTDRPLFVVVLLSGAGFFSHANDGFELRNRKRNSAAAAVACALSVSTNFRVLTNFDQAFVLRFLARSYSKYRRGVE